jgi:hypothetical protein
MYFARHRSRPLLAFVAAAAVVFAGCGTDNGDPNLGDPEDYEPPTSSSSTKDSGSRPPFEASVDDDASDGDAGDPDTDPNPDDPDQCIDTDDAGGSENLAKVLGDTDDKQNTPRLVTGVMNGAVDVDFYKFAVSDTTGALMDTDFSTTSSGVELCVWVKCKNGRETTVSSCKNGVGVTSQGLMQGCCGTAPVNVTPSWDCKGFTDDDSADVLVRVRQSEDKCVQYSWSYNF